MSDLERHTHRLTDLATSDPRVPSTQRPEWSIVYTRTNQEKALADFLHRSTIPFYLPLHPNPCQKNKAYTPLFSRFLFLYGGQTSHLVALSSELVQRIMPVHDQDRLRRDLLNLQKLLVSAQPLAREPDNLYGSECSFRVEGGALHGVSGMVIGADPPRLFVGIDCLRMGVSVTLESSAALIPLQP